MEMYISIANSIGLSPLQLGLIVLGCIAFIIYVFKTM